MKPLLILMRIIFVGVFWSIFFLEGIRVIMLKNWRFDILRKEHWEYAWDLWLSGWIIADAKEWAFVLIIITFIPLWLTGWAALSVISWEKLIVKIALFPVELIKRLFFKPVKIIASGGKKIQKKKSYKEIRPKSVRPISDDRHFENKAPMIQQKPIVQAAPTIVVPTQTESTPTTDNTAKFDHSLFKFDEDEDFDFDFDAFDEKPQTEEDTADTAKERRMPARSNASAGADKDRRNKNKKNTSNKDRNNTQNYGSNGKNTASTPAQPRSNNTVLDILRQKGYEVLTGLTIKNTLIDFIGVAANQICICLIDKEPGDWLADEERFNDEEPLWFSESSHRISPVRKVDLARKYLVEKLEEADLHFEVKAYVIEQIGNIINAEDMFEIWDDLKVNVTRTDKGTPKELKPFAKALDESIENIDKDKLEKIKKLIRNIS